MSLHTQQTFHFGVNLTEDERNHAALHSHPQLFRGGASEIVGMFGIDDVDRLLTIQGLGHPHLFLFNSTKGIKKFPYYPYSEPLTRLYSPARVIQEQITKGTSVMIHNLHRHHPAICALHAALRATCRALDCTVCFLSPPRSQGTMPHADDHPNVVVQLEGQKRWFVWGSVDENEISSIRSVKELESRFTLKTRQEALVDSVLNPGDVLVVPQRFLHTARTLEAWSLSIVFQIRCCDLDRLCEDIADRGLPIGIEGEGFVSVL